MNIVLDERKRIFNLDKHGYDFASFDYEMLDGAYIEASYSNRFKAITRLEDNAIAVVFGLLGKEAISLISMRRANKKERDKLT
jgi:uncharacterized protein